MVPMAVSTVPFSVLADANTICVTFANQAAMLGSMARPLFSYFTCRGTHQVSILSGGGSWASFFIFPFSPFFTSPLQGFFRFFI